MKTETLFKKLKEELNSLYEVYWIIPETELNKRLIKIEKYKTKLKKLNFTTEKINQFDF